MKAQPKQQIRPLARWLTGVKRTDGTPGACTHSETVFLAIRSRSSVSQSTTAAQSSRKAGLFWVSPHSPLYERVSDSVLSRCFLRPHSLQRLQLYLCPPSRHGWWVGVPTHMWNWANSQQDCWHRPTLPPILVWIDFKIDTRSGEPQRSRILFTAMRQQREGNLALNKENNLLSRTTTTTKEYKRLFQGHFYTRCFCSLQFLKLDKIFHELFTLIKVGPFSEVKCLLRNGTDLYKRSQPTFWRRQLSLAYVHLLNWTPSHWPCFLPLPSKFSELHLLVPDEMEIGMARNTPSGHFVLKYQETNHINLFSFHQKETEKTKATFLW